MFCAHCGSIGPDNASFCPACGKSLAPVGSSALPASARADTAASSAVLDPPAAEALYNVGTTKFVVMTLSTFGLYEVYWLYKNWSVEARAGADISPLARAVFAPLFVYSLAEHNNARAISANLQTALNPWLVSIAFLLLTVAVRLPSPFWLIGLMSGFVLIPIQKQSARINAARAIGIGKEARFSPLNIVWLVVSAVFWLLVLVGSLLPEIEAAALLGS
jgi:hypothetical protein